METRYIIILDYSVGEVIKIRLTDEQLRKSEEYEDFESYLSTLEGKYDFSISDCIWMSCETLQERSYL